MAKIGHVGFIRAVVRGPGLWDPSAAPIGASEPLETTIREYLAITNERQTPFVWTKTADEILEGGDILSANL